MMGELLSESRDVAHDRRAIASATSLMSTARVFRSVAGAAVAFSILLGMPPAFGQTPAAVTDVVEANRLQVPVTVDPQELSCRELKERLNRAGTLTILSGPRGSGDTFYGPRVPQCQFWTRPLFSFVNTRDGLCGVGYICVEKLGSAGGGM
jgi:hypothetical protein